MENNFSHSLLSVAESRIRADALELGVRLPWYRSLPLSVIEVADLTVDGHPIPHSDMKFEINGKSFSLDALRELTDEVWYVLDSAFIVARVPLQAGRDHDIALQLNLYPPYIPGLTWVTQARRTIRAPRGET